MRIDTVFIEEFKNLNQFYIDLDKKELNTVLLGQNATGKSNFIEAIIIIFRQLDLEEKAEFNYKIEYECRGKNIKISSSNKKYIFTVDKKVIKQTTFFRNKNQYLPKNVFTYYSGLSDRLNKLFWKHQDNFYRKIINPNFKKEEIDELRRLFYVQQIHSFFVLLAFYSFAESEDGSKDFLDNYFGIEDIDSILFVIKQPSWKNSRGDERFFGAEGLVQEFLSELWNFSLAPIYKKTTIYPDFRSKTIREQLYMYISSKTKLNAFAKAYFDFNNETPNNTFLFKAMESTYISDLLSEVRVKVRKKIDGKITFKELSEGEQQLLTVIGLLIFNKEEESLVLLDEPDTHLNPLWKWNYLELINNIFKKDSRTNNSTTQIIINTHDPLVVGSLRKEEIRIFKRDLEGKIVTEIPEKDARGMGVAGILTSELFGLPTILDKKTQTVLNRKRYLQGKLMRNVISNEEYEEYKIKKAELEEYGFYEEVEDKWFQMYLSEMSKYDIIQKIEFSEEEKETLENASKAAVEKILKEMNK